jgi:homogentisate 1,2-dioxygenase
MPIYHKLGKIPPKRHIQFRQPNGHLYHEQLFGTIGFDGMSTLMYHLNPPTMVKEIVGELDCTPEIAVRKSIKSRLLKGFEVLPEKDYLLSRKVILANGDLQIALAAPLNYNNNYFYKNADADELLFVHLGKGTLKTQLGNIAFESGDYLLVPRGMIYQIDFFEDENRLFLVESKHPIFTPKRYRNYFGQMLEHAPFCERDYKLPSEIETIDQKGDFLVKIKKENVLYDVLYPHHPFDVVGWDGYNFPYGFSIHNFEPITGRIHQPPPVHQTFETAAFVVCSFCPRLYDYHPQAIPAPYNHSNIDSDELLYYVDGDFMSRNNIEKGHLTLHPGGIPHGPAPGAYERSIGKKETQELAVMVDTFRPLQLTKEALRIQDDKYYQSWMH